MVLLQTIAIDKPECSLALRMELIFKYPDKKPPFFGIKFEAEHHASMLNQRWLGQNIEWSVRIEVLSEGLEVTIYSKKEFKHTYNVKKYDKAALKKFMRETRQHDQINFGHATQNSDGSHKIIRTSINNAPWVLPIAKIEVLSEH